MLQFKHSTSNSETVLTRIQKINCMGISKLTLDGITGASTNKTNLFCFFQLKNPQVKLKYDQIR